MDTVTAMFVDLGLPGWLAYPVLVIELIGGLALILGLAAIMTGAIVTVKWKRFYWRIWNKHKKELPL
ncbi:DoxX family protein [uncultured Brevibacillus sp.]|uniref:DoxX family protein n=1 Tax=uncultured Brevibacillus sp. TaxID=169970 RepID=UPI0025919764|nr:DoxX family membrane protein [uncultured Brevibacillus sp.]